MISTFTLIFSAVYVIGVSFTVGFFIADQMAFASPKYVQATITALLWPVVVVVVAFQSMTGIYLDDVCEDVVSWYKQWRCSHESIERCGNYEIDGREPNERCQNCGKIWWKGE
jgi:hypothetical protein